LSDNDEWEADDHDGALFRFWIRAASLFPSETAMAITYATTPAEYRKALTDLAVFKRINLPAPPIDQRLKMAMIVIPPRPPTEHDMTDEFKVRAFDALRDYLYREGKKSDG